MTTTWKPFAAFVLGLVALWLAYAIALPGFFLFDDEPNLQKLEFLSDWRSAAAFILSGNSGPLGRPLSLASFAAQASAWPDHPERLLRVNFAIHLLATTAVFALVLGLMRIRPIANQSHATWLAAAIALIWGFSPFLATTHLMIIQRMTGLAGLFVFLGLAGFVWAHCIRNQHPVRSRIMLVASLGLGTLFASLSKENGALLPALSLVILYLWIPKEQRATHRVDRSILFILAVLPTALIFGYLLYHASQALVHGYGLHRQFTPEQRLLTQPWILLDYVQNLLLPRAINVSPFTDHIQASTGWLMPPITTIAVIAWALIIAAALRLRSKAPYLLFGICFFLVGHLLESTIIGLELYFAHRNYVPSFGLYFALIFAIGTMPARYLRTGFLAVSAYALLFLAVLVQTAYQWKDVAVTSELWLAAHPESIRAAQFAATQHLQQGNPAAAVKILDDAARSNPDDAMIQVQSVLICTGREHLFHERLIKLESRLRHLPLSRPTVSELSTIAQSKLTLYCPQLTYQMLIELADALLANPSYQQSPHARSHLLIAKAFSYAEQAQMEQAADLFAEAFWTYPVLDTAFTAASLMSNLGDYQRAKEFLSAARTAAPESFLKQKLWHQRLDAFDYIIEKSRLIEGSTTGS
ncbi:tetratricopeptide repeat protein [Thiohalocapsa marina]|uniref:Tetratricopeptide repeat protein n=1 Tax=Thiohalocapsa marina TaxID=424902 RepID=A0A5M8FK13_9GAMM|nr:tetratricopeptide repeat protein [Thiohalocapsa marina]KAA6184834.1 tetratricopeptide repeat protein [Thiohalocapsa marina]